MLKDKIEFQQFIDNLYNSLKMEKRNPLRLVPESTTFKNLKEVTFDFPKENYLLIIIANFLFLKTDLIQRSLPNT